MRVLSLTHRLSLCVWVDMWWVVWVSGERGMQKQKHVCLSDRVDRKKGGGVDRTACVDSAVRGMWVVVPPGFPWAETREELRGILGVWPHAPPSSLLLGDMFSSFGGGGRWVDYILEEGLRVGRWGGGEVEGWVGVFIYRACFFFSWEVGMLV